MEIYHQRRLLQLTPSILPDKVRTDTESRMVIEYTATPGDVAALYSYARRHSLKSAVIFYGLPIVLAAIILLDRRSPGHSLTLTDWLIALIWGAVIFSLFPLILRLRTKKDKRTLSIQPDKLSTQIGKLNGDGEILRDRTNA
jgi:hypothetical protein